MWEVFKLALLSPKDYLGALNKRELIFKQVVDEGNNIYSFEFELPKSITWRAGQHAIFRFPDKKITGRFWRAFSLAASAHEGLVRIGTICVTDCSDFKSKLQGLRPGDKFSMNGPFGEFYVTPKDTQLIGVAGGIGITPFRAILHDIAHGHIDVPITLIYAARPGAHTYKSDLDKYIEMSDQIKVLYVNETSEVFSNLEALIHEYENDASYFISGSPGMIKSLRETLLQHSIERIVNDPFKGY